MMEKTILLVLTVAVLAVAELTDLSHEVSTTANVGNVLTASSITPLMARLKKKLTCQLTVVNECEKKFKDCEGHQSVYKDCKDAYSKGQRANKVYILNPDNGHPFQAYCNMNTDGGGWTVFQRRKDGSVNFQRGWNDYVKGFGNPDGEHWLGLEKIHRLTKASSVLRVDMTSYSKGSRYAKYTFKVGNAASKYTLQATSYSGNAGNALGYHNGMKFSTKDNDNDRWGSNCASHYKGGWWFNACHYSDLNGIYAGRRASNANYCAWYQFDNWYSLKFAEMKTRRQ